MPTDEKQAQFAIQVRNVAIYMPGWEVVPQKEVSSFAELRDDQGRTVHFYLSWRDNAKTEILGGYPKHGNTMYPSTHNGLPRINVSLFRHPEQVAKDIARRFIPQYFPLYAEGLVQRARAIQEENRRTWEAKYLSALLNTEVRCRSERPYLYPEIPGNSTVTFEGSYRNSWSIQIRGDFATACKVAKVLVPKSQTIGEKGVSVG